ncbi:ENV1 protein, partial [Ptilorrhoa leucosticta]|nr:ENV1 protein [Ptilorrhoa leucosticta]
QKYSTLWKMIQASYQVLNQTHPKLTKECWLCYSIKPPYYEAMGYPGRARGKNGTNPPECVWGGRDQNAPGITLASVTGKGICVG